MEGLLFSANFGRNPSSGEVDESSGKSARSWSCFLQIGTAGRPEDSSDQVGAACKPLGSGIRIAAGSDLDAFSTDDTETRFLGISRLRAGAVSIGRSETSDSS